MPSSAGMPGAERRASGVLIKLAGAAETWVRAGEGLPQGEDGHRGKEPH